MKLEEYTEEKKDYDRHLKQIYGKHNSDRFATLSGLLILCKVMSTDLDHLCDITEGKTAEQVYDQFRGLQVMLETMEKFNNTYKY